MIKYRKWFIVVALFTLTLLLISCNSTKEPEELSNNDLHVNDSIPPDQEDADPNADSENQKSEPHPEAEAEVIDSTMGPADQGALDIWFTGEIEASKERITLTGTTNLLPDSRLRLLTDAEGGYLIGSNDQTLVQNDGTFTLQASLPKGVGEILHIELEFDPYYQDEEIKTHYVGKMEGHLLRLRAILDEQFEIASVKQTIWLQDEAQTLELAQPSWDVPVDYQSPEVRLDADITTQGDYVVINLTSNITEHTFIRANVSVPNYITFGFQGTGYTNPDGSAAIYIDNPALHSKLENVAEYDIIIQMDPWDSNNGKHVDDLYGELGEKLSGEYVKTESDDRRIIERKYQIRMK